MENMEKKVKNIEKENKGFGVNLLLLIISLVTIFLIMEGVIRIIKPAIFYKKEMIGWKVDDYKLLTGNSDQFRNYVLNPNISLWHKDNFGEYDYLIETGDFNGVGFRKDSFETSSDKNKTVVWNFGDSFAFGFGVENNKTYSAILSANGFKSSNFGQPGFTLYQELALFKELYKKTDKKPEIVTFGIFLGNDVTEYGEVVHPRAVLASRTSDTSPIITRIVRKIEYYLDSKFYLYHFLSERSIELIQKISGRNAQKEYDFAVPPGYFVSNHLSSSLDSIPYNLVNNFLSTITDFPFEDYLVKFRILIFPSKEMLLEVKSFPERHDETNKISEMIKLSNKHQNVQVIDYFDSALASKEFWFFPKDIHFNAYGHKMVAEELMNIFNKDNNKK